MRTLLLMAALALAWPVSAHETHAPKPLPPDPALAGRPALPRIGPAPDLALADTAGQPVRLDAAAGAVRLVSFIYTTCTTACPILTQKIAALQESLDHEHALDRVRLYSVTVDPARDDVATMTRYAAGFDADTASWSFLTGPIERVDPQLAAWDEWRRPLPNGELDHPARLYLIDRAGTIREIYSLGFFDERQALIDIRALLAEGA